MQQIICRTNFERLERLGIKNFTVHRLINNARISITIIWQHGKEYENHIQRKISLGYKIL